MDGRRRDPDDGGPEFAGRAGQAIETAAMIAGQSLSDFVVDATTERAREVIRQPDALALTARDRARVMA